MPITIRSRYALRWAVGLIEPLLSTTQRIQFDHDFREVARDDPKWFAAVCSGVLSGIVISLPLTDPWRTATVDADGVARWHKRAFGRREDADDVLRPISDEIDDIDPTMLALEAGIATDAAALLVTSFGGWRDANVTLTEVQNQHGPDTTFDVATSALRWGLHRRRAYRPEYFDAYLDFLILGWAGGWSDDVVANGVLGDAAGQELEDRARIERDVLAKVAADLEFFTDD